MVAAWGPADRYLADRHRRCHVFKYASQAIADTFHKSVGFSKKMFDLVNITIAIVIGLSVVGELSGVGIGTVLAVIGVGRSIALFNHLTLHRLNELAGLNAAS